MDNSDKKIKADISVIDDDDIATIRKKILKSEITVKEAIKKYKIRSKHIYYPRQTSKHKECQAVFTKEQEKALKEHIIKCSKVQYNLTISTMRSMTYVYAVKLPGCKYPKKWDEQKMATMEWFKRFRARYPDLKNITTRKKNSCICIMGCHMGPEGKNQLKRLEARVLIARVYHYLHKEYEYMKMSNDLSLLLNILRRTAEATGVCEQTITSILDEEQKIQHSLHEDVTPAPYVRVPKKRKMHGNVMSEHDYTYMTISDNSGESPNMDSANNDSKTESNGISNNVATLEMDTNMETTNEDANEMQMQNTGNNDTSNVVVSIDLDSNIDQPVIEDLTHSNDNSDNMMYSNIESNVNSIVEVANTENISDVTDLDSNMDTVVEVSDSESDEVAYSSVYSDFERLQQDASLIKSIQVEILEDDDEQNEKAEPKEATMEVALVEVEPNKQTEKSCAEPSMEVALVEVGTNKQENKSKTETGAVTMEIIPIKNVDQGVKSDADVDTMTVEIIPVELCNEAVTANDTMKVLLAVKPKEVPSTEKRKIIEEERKTSDKDKEVSVLLEDDNDDDDNTFDIQRDPRSILRSTRSLFYTSKYYSNKLKKVGTPLNRLHDNYL